MVPEQVWRKGAHDQQQTIDRLVDQARAEFPSDIVHREKSIVGRQTQSGRTIRKVERNPDVWVEDATKRGTVKELFEAGRTSADGTFVSREMKEKKQYDALGIESHFEPIPRPPDPNPAPRPNIEPED